jgi:iron complex transport system substrate-binding protein
MSLTMATTARYLVTHAGGRYGAEGAIVDNAIFSIEQLMNWDPDIFLIAGNGSADVDYIYREKLYSNLKAVKKRKVYPIPHAAHVWANYTPEQPLAILWLAKLIYPDRFKKLDIAGEVKYFYRKFFEYSLSDAQVREIIYQ